MQNVELQLDLLSEYEDALEVKCVDEEGNIYTIEGEDTEAGDNDGDEARGGYTLFLKLKIETKPKRKLRPSAGMWWFLATAFIVSLLVGLI